jgi:hypothetical protein
MKNTIADVLTPEETERYFEAQTIMAQEKAELQYQHQHQQDAQDAGEEAQTPEWITNVLELSVFGAGCALGFVIVRFVEGVIEFYKH